jgi:hypothetical protein
MFIDVRYDSRARAPEERNVSGEENTPFRSAGARRIFFSCEPINIRSLRDAAALDQPCNKTKC